MLYLERQLLAQQLSPSAAIACRGSPLQIYNAGRYWGVEYSKNASVVVFPASREDVSNAVKAAATSPLGQNLAFVSGGHGQTNASSSTGFVLDLSWMNTTQILHNVTLNDTFVSTAIAYEGGANWTEVTSVTNGTGYAAVAARDGDVGVGGFSTGGGIGWVAGVYGYAIDRLRAAEVVLMSGEIVLATQTNQYSDLFWALQGGGGQFGIVTKFYQEAFPEPQRSQLGFWIVNRDSWTRAQENTAEYFATNSDPFSLMYYSVGYYPQNLTTPPLSTQMVILGLLFNDPNNPSQPNFTSTFAPLISGITIDYQILYELPFADLTTVATPFFPYGFRRGFWGPQTTNVSASYLASASNVVSEYINGSLARGESPEFAFWNIQFMFPGQNGHAPASDSDTAWPHATSAHQSLFSPAWNRSVDDAFVEGYNDRFNRLTWQRQAQVGGFIADYPNYISPNVTGHRVWGENVGRLIEVKGKYDPECRIHQGRVFASKGCVEGGWADVFPG
ncbi:MAG: hypothetical protein M1821_000687 [Bathelium mastoideum]|nr:MAG: hypothetical protein M1821_000687 [Bathelium mastoideum]